MKYIFTISNEDWIKCQEFAKKCALTHRKQRSGGSLVRSIKQTERDILQGKIGEEIARYFLETLGVKGIELDYEDYGSGVWDDADILIGKTTISVKSTKFYSRWFLKEKKDIDRGDIYDYYILVTIDMRLINKGQLPFGMIRGYLDKDTLLSDNHIVRHLNKGENIPNTNTHLDADNYAVHCNNLFNNESDWVKLARILSKCLLSH